VERVDRRVGGAVVDFRLKFIVRNDGGSGELSRHRGGIPVGDTTILPSLSFLHNEWLLRVTLSAKEMTVDDVERALRAVFSSEASIAYRAVSEVSRGDVCHTRFADVLDFSSSR
jgi:hypothetical protein